MQNISAVVAAGGTHTNQTMWCFVVWRSQSFIILLPQYTCDKPHLHTDFSSPLPKASQTTA